MTPITERPFPPPLEPIPEPAGEDQRKAPPTQIETRRDRMIANARSILFHALVVLLIFLFGLKFDIEPAGGGLVVGMVFEGAGAKGPEEDATRAAAEEPPPVPEVTPEPDPIPEVKSDVPPLEPTPPPPPPKPRKKPVKPKPETPVAETPTVVQPGIAGPSAEAGQGSTKGNEDPDTAIGALPGEESGNGGLGPPEVVTPDIIRALVQDKSIQGKSGFLDGITGRYEGTWTAHFGTDGTSELLMTYPQYDAKTGITKNREIRSKGVWWQEGDRLCFSYREVDQSAKDCFRVVKRGDRVRLFYEKCGLASTSRCASGRLAIFGKMEPGKAGGLQ